MRLMFFLIATCFLVGSAWAQDPYADTYREEQSRQIAAEKSKLISDAKIYHFAAECKVIDPAIASAITRQQTYIVILRYPGQLDGQLYAEVERQARDGAAIADDPQGCDYWKANPDMLYTVRQNAKAIVGAP